MRILIKIKQIIHFILFYLWELTLSNLRVAHDVLTPTHYMKPGIVAIPLDTRNDFEVLTMANLLTMTPGTISLDVADDRKTLYIHAMYIDDLEQLRADVKHDFERRVMEVLR